MPIFNLGISINAKNNAQSVLNKYQSQINSALKLLNKFNLGQVRFSSMMGKGGLNQRIMISGLFALGSALVYSSSKFEAFRESADLAFTNILGNIDAADARFNDLINMSLKTPFGGSSLVVASQQMEAYGYSIQQTDDMLKTFADAASSVPAPVDNAMSIMAASFDHMKETGIADLSDVMNMEQAGIPAIELLSKALNIQGPMAGNVVRKLLGRGIPASMITGPLLAQMKKQYAGLANAQSQTLGPVLAKTRSLIIMNFSEMLRPVLEKIRALFIYINSGLAGFYNWMIKLPKPVKDLVAVLSGISLGLVGILAGITGFLAIAAVWGAGFTAIGNAIAFVTGAAGLGAFLSILGLVGLVIGGLILSFTAWTNNWLGIRGAIESVTGPINSIIGALDLFGTIISGVFLFPLALFVAWQNNWLGVKSFIEGLLPSIGNDINTFVTQTIPNIWNQLPGVLTSVLNWFGGIPSTLSNIWNSISTTMSNFWNSLPGFFDGIYNSLVNGNLFNWFGNLDTWIYTNVWGPIGQDIYNFWTWLPGFFDSIMTYLNNSSLFSWFGNLYTWIGQNVWGPIGRDISSFWGGLVTWFDTYVWGPLSSDFSTQWQNITNIFTGTLNLPSLYNIGVTWIQSFINGIMDTLKNFEIPVPTISITVGYYVIDGVSFPDPQVNIGVDWQHIPGLAEGGLLTSGGTVLVGERGPELLNLPGGASVSPMNRTAPGGDTHLHMHMEGAQIYGMDHLENTIVQMINRSQRRGRLNTNVVAT